MMNGATVDNVIMADNKEATERSLRCTLIPLDDLSPVGFGWRFVDGQWVAPEEPPVE